MSNRWIFIIFSILLVPQIGFGQEKYWIFFSDKGYSGHDRQAQLAQAKQQFTWRALQRRAKMMGQQEVVGEDDLPLYQPYLDQLARLGIRPIVQSRWLNAISARMTQDQIDQVRQIRFIQRIQPVGRFNRELPETVSGAWRATPAPHRLDYGPSLDQNQIMHVPEVHDLGLDGSGVIVGMLDTGYDYQQHEAFSQMKVIAEYDFINNDSTTQNESDDNDAYSQHYHGTYTLSALGGFAEGRLIGPAYGASFLLAKTEDVRSETRIEEDYWVAGIEWLEAMGADVVNSSLGYNDWYNYEDMNGRTAVTTLAADRAVLKGVVVVNSNGNEGSSLWRHMMAPADGFYVISVGAVYNTGELVSFSSRGPTYDGRIKPDVVAMGSGVISAQANTISDYQGVSGTSLSSPLVAGVAALILQAHPYLTPLEVRDALRETADRAQNPDNDYGWGLVNAYEAIFYHGLFFSSQPKIFANENIGHLVTINIFSKYNLNTDALFVYYAVPGQSFSPIRLEPSLELNEYRAWLPKTAVGTEIKLYFSAADEKGNVKYHPHRAPEEYFKFLAFDSSITRIEPPQDFRLYQNYPNPFSSSTTIRYDLERPAQVTLIIYNVRSQQVRKIVDQFQNPDNYQHHWDGRDDHGALVASGLYFYRLQAGSFSATKRMVFLKEKTR